MIDWLQKSFQILAFRFFPFANLTGALDWLATPASNRSVFTSDSLKEGTPTHPHWFVCVLD